MARIWQWKFAHEADIAFEQSVRRGHGAVENRRRSGHTNGFVPCHGYPRGLAGYVVYPTVSTALLGTRACIRPKIRTQARYVAAVKCNPG